MSTAPPVEPPDTTGPSGESKPADSPIEIYRHSSAHLLAAAVTELYPDAQCGIGPPTEDGFFYDFLVSQPFTPEDLAAIEKKMAHIVKQNRPIEKKLIPKAEALELFAKKGQTLKCQLIKEKAGDPVQCYTMGEFIDFCLGPHLPSTGKIKAFKLTRDAVAVLLEGQGRQPGDAAHLRVRLLHEGGAGPAPAPARGGQAPRPSQAGPRAGPLLDRRRDRGRASILWHPKGGFIRKQIEDFWRDEHLRGRLRPRLHRPTSRSIDLWNTSGHTEYYKANMYSPIDIEGVEYQLKPMNCPFHITIYQLAGCAATASCRSATRSSAPSTASSARACCTA